MHIVDVVVLVVIVVTVSNIPEKGEFNCLSHMSRTSFCEFLQIVKLNCTTVFFSKLKCNYMWPFLFRY